MGRYNLRRTVEISIKTSIGSDIIFTSGGPTANIAHSNIIDRRRNGNANIIYGTYFQTIGYIMIRYEFSTNILFSFALIAQRTTKMIENLSAQTRLSTTELLMCLFSK